MIEFVKKFDAMENDGRGALTFHVPPEGSIVWHEGELYKVLDFDILKMDPPTPEDEMKLIVQFKAEKANAK